MALSKRPVIFKNMLVSNCAHPDWVLGFFFLLRLVCGFGTGPTTARPGPYYCPKDGKYLYALFHLFDFYRVIF
jgi:hypothetical protein